MKTNSQKIAFVSFLLAVLCAICATPVAMAQSPFAAPPPPGGGVKAQPAAQPAAQSGSRSTATPPTPPDSDGDGIIDKKDKCPNEKGVEPDGCPPNPECYPFGKAEVKPGDPPRANPCRSLDEALAERDRKIADDAGKSATTRMYAVNAFLSLAFLISAIVLYVLGFKRGKGQNVELDRQAGVLIKFDKERFTPLENRVANLEGGPPRLTP